MYTCRLSTAKFYIVFLVHQQLISLTTIFPPHFGLNHLLLAHCRYQQIQTAAVLRNPLPAAVKLM